MRFSVRRVKLPTLTNSLLAVLSAALLSLSFPDFDFSFFAWFALVPLFFAVEREKESVVKSFVLGWVFGVAFFFATCWWLTFAPVTYGGVPSPVAYLLLCGATTVVGLFPAVFAALFSLVLRRFGARGIFSAPFLWTAIEFLRFWATGNNWNAIAYSQAFDPLFHRLPGIGGIYLVGFFLAAINAALLFSFINDLKHNILKSLAFAFPFVFILTGLWSGPAAFWNRDVTDKDLAGGPTKIIAVQPNVPMSGLSHEDRERLLKRHIELAEKALLELKDARHPAADGGGSPPTVVIFPESPMNFEYDRDREFQGILREFTVRNNVSVLFNAAEPALGDRLYNSAVLVDERGVKVAQYDKIHLVPFGEYAPVPSPLAEFVPTMVGSYEFGKSYELMPFGGAGGGSGDPVQAGIMICFESHFPTLSRAFALRGADVLVELTNDGYLGDTPVLRQHLANAVFRALETNRPLLRVTNVGITAYIDGTGRIYDESKAYAEAVRVWSVKKADAPPTFYVRYGDWFAWACSAASLILLAASFRRRKVPPAA